MSRKPVQYLSLDNPYGGTQTIYEQDRWPQRTAADGPYYKDHLSPREQAYQAAFLRAREKIQQQVHQKGMDEFLSWQQRFGFVQRELARLAERERDWPRGTPRYDKGQMDPGYSGPYMEWDGRLRHQARRWRM